jgi:methylated-DNA-[protein]-cysteine S-methyltransferase
VTTRTLASATYATTVESFIGTVVLKADDDGLTECRLPKVNGSPCMKVAPGPMNEHLDEAVRQLEEYFEGRREDFDLTLTPAGTPFQRQVWFELAEIPYGETISYAELARRVERPQAFRAVGQANGANPLAIVLPCHRVIASGGGLGGYGGGLAMKRQLLAHENGGGPLPRS